MAKADFIGNRGQSLAHARLTEVCRQNGKPFFDAHFLGDKCPLFDFLVVLVGAGVSPPFFFVQVKATRKGLTAGSPPRLRVTVAKRDVRDMVRFRAPTYVIGVDEPGERAFVVAIFGTMKQGFSSMSTQHPLNCSTLRDLWTEVRDYWRGHNMHQVRSQFVN